MSCSPGLDIVIPVYGSAGRLKALLGALNSEARSQSRKLVVIVSDDGSPTPLEGEVAPVDLSYLSLRFVRGTNGGPGAARNRGIACSESEWIAFLDADTIPAEGWLAAADGLIAEGEGVDGFEGAVRVPDAGGASPFAHATEIAQEVAHGGANIIYRRSSLSTIGGFSGDYYDARRRMHFREDNDLYFRAITAGMNVQPSPSIIAYHPSLESSLLTPVRLARRYYFDVLLSKRYPVLFKQLNDTRRVGPVSLRVARHWAATAHVASALAVPAFAVRDHQKGVRLAAAAGLATWLANGAAIGWGKRVHGPDLVRVAGIALATPWVYCWHYYRGVIEYRHLPRL